MTSQITRLEDDDVTRSSEAEPELNQTKLRCLQVPGTPQYESKNPNSSRDAVLPEYPTGKNLCPLRVTHFMKHRQIHGDKKVAGICQEKLGTAVTSASSSGCRLQLGQDGKSMTLTFNEESDIEPIRCNATWLRHNCHCPSCKQTHSGQKLFEPHELQASYKLKSAELRGEELVLRWHGGKAEEDHEGSVPLQFLMHSLYSDAKIQKMAEDRTPLTVKGRCPSVTFEEISESDEGLFKWLHCLNEYGMCVVREVPTREGMVKEAAEKIWSIQQTIYGELFDVVSTPKPINVAYSDAKLGFHMDLAYYESPPGLQFLHCLKFDDCVEGGDSLLVDAWHVAEQLKTSHPEHFETLARVPATLQKIHFDREKPVYMKYQRPHIACNPRGDVIAVHWAPSFEGPLCVPEEDIEPYYAAYHKFAEMIELSETKVQFRLEEGDLLSFNNRRMLHARDAFVLNGGMRHLQGCYVNIDEFQSRVEVIKRRIGSEKLTRRVMNACWS
ncbi:hypothetical protein CAPTEDRAFT_227933 [Capitella teleta]|uniref:Gamma-butyrobetaine dioxygenase n=1 Tax=Capitella teleta TaxID=283909 RepID=R7TRD3_CAPTE|nr:hypothetical protein CAPTEDRAFT_227933 [Capitella teleta]|eukprot:ELT94056.1 hypothetical protein CAPTEDRAFT_227933 [Capitella teleta]